MRAVGKHDTIKAMIQNQKKVSNPKRVSGQSVLPFLIEFVKFSTGFAAIIAVGLFSLHIANAAI